MTPVRHDPGPRRNAVLGPLDPWSFLATTPAVTVAVVAGIEGVPRLAVVLGLLALLIALVDSFCNRRTPADEHPSPRRAGERRGLTSGRTTVTRPQSDRQTGLRAHGGISRG